MPNEIAYQDGTPEGSAWKPLPEYGIQSALARLYKPYTSPYPNPPLPIISASPCSPAIRRAACSVTSSVFVTIPADTSGFAMARSISSGSFDYVRRPNTHVLQAGAGNCPRPSSRKMKYAFSCGYSVCRPKEILFPAGAFALFI